MPYVNPTPELSNIQISENEEICSDYNEKKQVYFAFIDVLGFKNTFGCMPISSEQDKTDKYKNVFNYYFELMNASDFMKTTDICYAGQTSDSLYFYTDRSDYLVTFMKTYLYFSLYAMEQNVFFRGGIAKGNLSSREKHQFYGNSVIFAYQLESCVSKYPIVVIDENTKSAIIEEAPKGMIEKDNNRSYLNPFFYLNNRNDLDIDKIILKQIEPTKISDVIHDNMKFFEYNPEIYEKYAFLEQKLKLISNKLP